MCPHDVKQQPRSHVPMAPLALAYSVIHCGQLKGPLCLEKPQEATDKTKIDTKAHTKVMNLSILGTHLLLTQLNKALNSCPEIPSCCF